MLGYGDATSRLTGALVSANRNISVPHVEPGLGSEETQNAIKATYGEPNESLAALLSGPLPPAIETEWREAVEADRSRLWIGAAGRLPWRNAD